MVVSTFMWDYIVYWKLNSKFAFDAYQMPHAKELFEKDRASKRDIYTLHLAKDDWQILLSKEKTFCILLDYMKIPFGSRVHQQPFKS